MLIFKFLQYFQRARNYIESDYPQSKLDIILHPGIPFGGLENYGLIILNGNDLLRENGWSNRLIAHEIIHQWVGNNFTIENWDELCLQEGLATYLDWKFSSETTSYITPEELVKKAVGDGLDREQFDFGPMIRPMFGPKDAQLCYTKGPWVFHALAERFGADSVKEFVHVLMRNFPNGNADFQSWQKFISITAKDPGAGEFLRKWYSNSGYPVLMFDLRSNSDLTVRQKFVKKSEILPINTMILDGGTLRQNIKMDSERISMKVPEISTWFLANVQQTEFHESLYDLRNYRKLLLCAKNQPCASESNLKREFMDQSMREFCRGLKNNLVPIEGDAVDRPLLQQAHLDLVDLNENFGAQYLQDCSCCFYSEAFLRFSSLRQIRCFDVRRKCESYRWFQLLR